MVIVCTWNLYLSMLNVKLAAINPLGKLEGWAAWISHFVNYILCNNKGKIRKCTFSCFSVYFSTRIYFFLSNDKSLMHFFTQKKLPKKRKLGELMSNIGRHFFNIGKKKYLYNIHFFWTPAPKWNKIGLIFRVFFTIFFITFQQISAKVGLKISWKGTEKLLNQKLCRTIKHWIDYERTLPKKIWYQVVRLPYLWQSPMVLNNGKNTL